MERLFSGARFYNSPARKLSHLEHPNQNQA